MIVFINSIIDVLLFVGLRVWLHNFIAVMKTLESYQSIELPTYNSLFTFAWLIKIEAVSNFFPSIHECKVLFNV